MGSPQLVEGDFVCQVGAPRTSSGLRPPQLGRLKQVHEMEMNFVDALSGQERARTGTLEDWSAKDIISHITARKALMADRQSLNSTWVKKDIELIRTIASAFPSSFDTGSLVETLCPHGDEHRDLGFGVSLIKCDQGGGYLRISIRIADFRGKAAIIRVDFDGHKVRDVILEGWPHDLEEVNQHILRYQTRDKALSEAITRSIADSLGSYSPPTPDPRYQEEYETLMDPLAEHHYGHLCYFAAKPPAARDAIENLIAGEQYQLIRSVLRSPNPEARVYAVEALRRLEKSDVPIQQEDRKAIDFLASQTMPVYVCSGCLVFSTPQGELLEERSDLPLSPD
jgi:hypothetical protein